MLDRAVKALSIAAVPASEQAQRREWQSDALWELARILRATNDPAQANRIDAERAALWQDRRPAELADLALKQVTLAVLIGYGKTPVSPQALTVRRLDLERASANLELAIDRGFRDLPMLLSHPDSQFLLAKDDLKLRIMDRQFPARPFRTESK